VTRWPVVLMLVLGCTTPPGGAQTDTAAEGTGDAATTGADTEPDPTATGGVTSSSPSTTACGTQDCATAGESTGDSDPLPPDELACDDDLDDDGDGRTDCFDDDCWTQAMCTDRFVRVATWNVRQIGSVASPEHDALLAVLARIDADIVCLQEVGDEEGAALDAVAQALGYAYVAAAPPSGGMGGMIRTACLSRHEIVQWDALEAADLSSDPFAADLSRAILRVRVRLEAVDRYLTVLSAHLKADVTDTDRFRRMVESIRLGSAIALEREIYPGNAIVALGDFNEELEHPQGIVFDAPPADLPLSYELGNDIAFPLPYVPFQPLEDEAVVVVDARVEDTAFRDTYLPGLVRLDYIYQDAAEVVVSEVYEACEDDGVDGNPDGDRMPKAGDPLPCGTNGDASDHRPVVAVFFFE
jgi:endonuclease/exonuclease/phosphatase family metal-dependent hydrolase